MPNLRKNDLAKIHIAKKELAMTDDSYRAMLTRVTGKESASALSISERVDVLNEFKRLGWNPKKTRNGHSYKKDTSRKILVLWRELHKEGKVRCATLKCMGEWLGNQQAGKKNPDWLTAQEAYKTIEKLKAWLQR